ncbi:MAG: hypothetical protein QOK11_1721, partial [Pseudonocardiales bacterium]|nr:hypothetical protein [Pseudonocardiales bacterium]
PRHYLQQLTELAAEGRRADTVEFFLTAAVGVPADALAALLGDAQRRTLPGQQHDVAPGVLAPVLADFFAG